LLIRSDGYVVSGAAATLVGHNVQQAVADGTRQEVVMASVNDRHL
jgi:hypothetical protein